ncbi:kelch-like protein 30 [Ptychodera flava]|uniref:kelch-like protein 30 n=1 Tax=Ptychodera flava TaxID=63121 RepID=UPI00396AAD54
MDAAESFARKWAALEEVHVECLSDWLSAVRDKSCSSICQSLLPHHVLWGVRRESRGHGVTIHGVSPSSLESVLEYVYTGTTQITNDNVETILSAASLFLLDDLEHRCVEHLKENLYFDNCIRVLKLSSAYSTSCSVLRKTAWVYAVHNLPEVMKSDDFVNLSEDELHQYLREARLYIDPHVPLFEAILKWWRFDGSRSLPRALSIAGISIELATSQIPNDELSALIQETAGDAGDKENPPLIDEVVVIVGGYSCPDSLAWNSRTVRRRRCTGRQVISYNGARRQWCELPDIPSINGGELSAAVVHNNIIVMLSDCPVAWKYLATDESWTEIKGVGDQRRDYCLQACHGYIYRIGVELAYVQPLMLR